VEADIARATQFEPKCIKADRPALGTNGPASGRTGVGHYIPFKLRLTWWNRGAGRCSTCRSHTRPPLASPVLRIPGPGVRNQGPGVRV